VPGLPPFFGLFEFDFDFFGFVEAAGPFGGPKLSW
jgi:hypothetical protein